MDISKPLKQLRILASPAAGAFAAGMVATQVVTLALYLGVSRTAWHLDIPPGVRWAVLVHALWQTWPVAAAIGCLMVFRLRHERWVRVTSFCIAGIVVFLWLASWATFLSTGQFLDPDSIALAVASPASMFLHVVDLALIALLAVPIAAVAYTMAVTWLARRLARAQPGWRAITLALSGLAVAVASSLSIYAESKALQTIAHVGHPEGGNAVRLSDLLELMQRDRSEPVAHLRASLRNNLFESSISPNVDVRWPEKTSYAALEPQRRYNVVVLVIESLRSDELNVYGSRLRVMPATDRLAQEATVFLEHYAVATHSNYSSVTPVSSQFPLRDERMHIYPKHALYARVLLYDVLKPLGYRTAIVSSQNENWGGMANFLASDRLDHFFHAGTYTGKTYIAEEDAGFARYAMKYGRSGKIDDAETINEAIRWIGSDRAAAPFMMYINLQNSHVPYPIPAHAPTPFGPRKASFPIGFNFFPPDSAQVVRGVYRNALHYVDAQVGRLIDHLKSTQQWQNTIFVLVGDHGQAFFEHGFAAHSNQLYEELLRTPLIISAPGMNAGLRTGLAQHVDIAPTILDLLDLPPHPGFQGLSLLDGPRRFAYSIVQSPMANQYGVVHGSNKLIIDARTNSAVLRDLKADPAEKHDASGRSEAVSTFLRERLETWHAAQLSYYTNAKLQSSVYPPILPEQTSGLAWLAQRVQ